MFSEINKLDHEISSNLRIISKFSEYPERIDKKDFSRNLLPYLLEKREVPIGCRRFGKSKHRQLLSIPWGNKRKSGIICAAPGAGKSVMNKTICFDFLHSLFGYHLVVFSPKIEYTSKQMRKNSRWGKELNNLGLPPTSHKMNVYTPSFVNAPVGKSLRYTLKDLQVLSDEEWDSALYDILGFQERDVATNVIRYIKSQRKPESLNELKGMIKAMFRMREDKYNLEASFHPSTLRSVYSRLLGADTYIGDPEDGTTETHFNPSKEMINDPLVFQTSTTSRSEFVNLYAGLMLQAIRRDRTKYVDLKDAGKPTDGTYLTKPVVVSIEEARFFAKAGREKSLSKTLFIDGVKTDRSPNISYIFVEQDLVLLEEMILNNVDFYIYKGVPSKENITCIRNAFQNLRKETIDGWVAKAHTADTEAGESPLATTVAYIDKSGIKLAEGIPSRCAIVEQAS